MFQSFADWLVYELLKIPQEMPLGRALNFFIYDTLKILFLLFIITLAMGFVNRWIPTARIRAFLTSRNWYGLDYLIAALFGALTPFCSCSSIPLFIGFVRGGIPLGITFAFLITSPLVNEVSIALFAASFGLKVTVVYVLSGVLLGMAGGFILGKLRLEKYLQSWVLGDQTQDKQPCACKGAKFAGVKTVVKDALNLVAGLFPYIVVGIGIGAAIHGFVPANFFAGHLGREKLWAVPFAVVLAVPMYANAAGVIPIVEALVTKGIPIGTVLAFMMAVVGLSLPEAILLKKIMTWRLIGIFFATVTVLIILSGYLFNAIL